MNRPVLGIIAVLLLSVSIAQPVMAQCVAGVPCVTADYTPGADPRETEDNNDTVTCDSDFMNQIYARAFMEAERENVTAQTHILKPDSVLAYSCIDQIIGQTNPNAINLFSNSNFFWGKSVELNIANTATASNPTSIQLRSRIQPAHYATALNDTVMVALNNFVSNNFGYDFLADTATGLSTSISSSAPGGGYSCDFMRSVWELAKCQNLEAGPDLFWTFQELVGGDPRIQPELGSCATDITAELIEVANNAGPTYPAVTFDALDPLLDPLVPATSSGDCEDPIPTGLDVTLYDFTFGAADPANPSGVTVSTSTIQEKVCPNPGCYYDATADTCEDG